MKRVTCLIGLVMAASLVASSLAAQEPVREREHVVRRGDTLWDLAAYYFSDPFEWPTIYEANTTVVEDPHWIYPDEVLVIPGLRGDTEPAPRVAMEPSQPLRTVFYRPPPAPPAGESGDPTVLSEPVSERVPVLSGEFNSAPYVGDPDDLEVVGRFIGALRENRDVGGRPSAHPGDEVFLGYEEGRRPEVDQQLLLMRTGKRLAGGRVLEPTGVVRITRLEDEVMFARIETQYAAVHRGQVLTPMPMYPDFLVEEARPIEEGDGYDLEGRVIEFIDDPPLPSRTDLGFVDLGGEDGVHVGDVFTAYLPARSARARELGDFLGHVEQLPPEQVARLRVMRVGEHVATVKVDQLMLPRLEGGIRVRRTHTVR